MWLRRYRCEVVVFCVLVFSFAYFQHSAPGWNVNSRFALTLALGETGSAEVSRYAGRPGLETMDLAEYEGRVYSDKSLGTSLLGVPALWAVKAMEAAAGTTFPLATKRWLVTALSVGVTGAVAGVLLMRWLMVIGAGASATRLRAACIVLAGLPGSLLYLYGTLFMSYLPATCFLVAMLLLVEHGLRCESGRRKCVLLLLAGLCGGLTVLCEYTYGAAAVLVGLMVIARLVGQVGVGRAVWPVALFGLGGVIGILPFFVYTIALFGQPGIPYQYHMMPEFREAMARGFMGAGAPDWQVLWLITFHPYRGLFVYSPLMLMGVLGVVVALVRGGGGLRRAVAGLCLANIVFYLLFNSAYYMWWGGWSFAPRHLAPALPFMLAGVLVWCGRGVAVRWLLGVAAAVGVAVHVCVNATEPQLPDGGWQQALLQPDMAQYDYPATFAAQIVPRLAQGAFDANLGTAVFGLPGGFGSLAPLVLVWCAGGVLLWRFGRDDHSA